jgi:hypothetical protein
MNWEKKPVLFFIRTRLASVFNVVALYRYLLRWNTYWGNSPSRLTPMRFRQVAEKVFSQGAYIGYDHDLKKKQ